MTEENKELLLKDLCARLPYGVKVRYSSYEKFITYTLHAINPVYDIVDLWSENACFNPVDTSKIKPYLFPLSSITIEQEKELSKLGVSYGECALHDDIRGLGIYVDEAYIFFEFCYKHHIDFLGLIEMGLANDATGLNIY